MRLQRLIRILLRQPFFYPLRDYQVLGIPLSFERRQIELWLDEST